jgi:hypothetical protein
MSIEKKTCRDRRDSRTTLSRLLPLLPIIALLVPVQSLDATVQPSSGTVQLGNVLTYGTTAYSVDYSHPATAEVGTNLTIAFTLHVNSLSGAIQYISTYGIGVYVYIGAQVIGNGSSVSASDAPHLYPGGSWGPNNVTIPLTASGTGLAKGQSANATVSFILQDQVDIANGRSIFFTNEPPMEGQAGSIVIHYPASSTTTSSASRGSGQTQLPELLLASGAVLMLLAVALWPRPPRRATTAPKAL